VANVPFWKTIDKPPQVATVTGNLKLHIVEVKSFAAPSLDSNADTVLVCDAKT
jgi:hypothetical protein